MSYLASEPVRELIIGHDWVRHALTFHTFLVPTLKPSSHLLTPPYLFPSHRWPSFLSLPLPCTHLLPRHCAQVELARHPTVLARRLNALRAIEAGSSCAYALWQAHEHNGAPIHELRLGVRP